MKRKVVTKMMLTLLQISILAWLFITQQVRSDWTSTETIYIRADGSIYPDAAPISSFDNITYTLTDNILGNVPQWTSAIAVERDNIVVDGAGYTLQGTYPSYSSRGIDLLGRSNVTIKNMRIKEFTVGISLFESSRNSISGNDITNNFFGFDFEVSNDNNISENNVANNYRVGIYTFGSWNNISKNKVANNEEYGIKLDASSASVSGNDITDNGCGIGIIFHSSHSSVFGNNITNNRYGIEFFMFSEYNSIFGNIITHNEIGIHLSHTSDNNISDNNIAHNEFGIQLGDSSYNSVFGNNIADNGCGINIWSHTPNNIIHHNNFVGNGEQASVGYYDSTNVWDDDYPSGGNYWSDHVTIDQYSGVDQTTPGSDEIVDEPYIINDYNRDKYPLVNPPVSFHDIGITEIAPSETSVEPGSMLDINITVVNYGLYSETFNLIAYANTTVISQTEVTLSSRSSATITFTWNTTGATICTYTLKAQASVVPGEIDTADNIFIDGQVTLSIHDIAINGVKPWPTQVSEGDLISVLVTVKNEGNVPETFNVTAYYDETPIGSYTDLSLNAGVSTTLEFLWWPWDIAAGTYTIKAQASTVPGEIDTTDNILVDGQVTVNICDIAVIQVTAAPTSVKVGETVYINVTVENQGSITETFDVTTYYNASCLETKAGISLEAGQSITLEFSWNTTGVAAGVYKISAYASPVPGETDTANNYLEDGMVTIVTPEYLTHKLIETIETWNLPEGTENSLVSKLEEAILLLDKENDNGAVHKIMDFMNEVEALRGGSLTDEQANYLTAEAQRIIDLIEQQPS